MRTGRTTVVMVAVAVAALLLGALPAAAQEAEEFAQPGSEIPLEGHTRTDGTIVLGDESFCRHLLGGLWGGGKLTYVDLIDKSKKQKRARQAAFTAGSDQEAVARCAEIIGAFRIAPPDDDTLAAWARQAPVVPQALESLLPADLVARPLAQPDEVGAAARTSGFGDTVSPPFEMVGQTWLAEVDAGACSVWTGSLKNTRDPDDVVELTAIREYLYNVDAGHYYWEVSAADCDWSVDLVPIDLGPEPTATPAPRVAVPALAGTDWRRHFETFLTASEARQALLEAGLTVGECTEEPKTFEGLPPVDADRIWAQDPVAGTLLEPGSAVDVTITSGCDILRGERAAGE